MPQNNFIEEYIKKHGRPLDYEIKKQKKEAREPHRIAIKARKLHGFKAKLFNKARRNKKIQMKKKLKVLDSKDVKTNADTNEAIPHYLMDREIQERAKALNDQIKERRQAQVGKYSLPIAKVKGVPEVEAFGVLRTGKKNSKQWKRVVTKPCFVGEDFTRKPPKYERFIRPMGLRMKKANVTHPELQATFCLPIIGLKRNPHSELYSNLGVLSKGTVIEVNVSELGMVAKNGNVVWGKYAQITNNPEYDGCVNAILLM
ncbi:Ribosome biogenesis protein NSA2 [Astathelohania contejeani]|uniref:Ribosome biogenesis protein NSA2 n=1 Tax=Astathelohania contejeani TaxID=164912 RepID=A0ABQ7I1U8_9MICR|nr:Ribosome biogenesis protein NSA2 [Thelohania contejeani]